MRTFSSAFLVLAPGLFVLAHCGSSSSPTLFDDGGASDGAPSDSSTPDGSPGDSGTADAQPIDASDCTALLADVAAKRDEATKCSPNLPVVQCDTQVQDLCCPITVANAASAATKAFQAAVAAADNGKCRIACPAIACHIDASGKCDSKASTCSQAGGGPGK